MMGAFACSQSVEVLERPPTTTGLAPAASPDAEVQCTGVDLQTDVHHCGACDRDCLVNACANGRCVPDVLHEGASGESFFGMTIDDSRLYWAASPAAVMVMPKDGSSPPMKLADADQPVAVAVDDAHVYWSQSGAIMTIAKDGSSAPVAFVSPAAPGGNIVLDTDAVYYLEVPHDTVTTKGLMRASKRDGATTQLDTAAGGGTASATLSSHWLARDGSYLYWPAQGVVTELLVQGGGEAQVEGPDSPVCGLASDHGDIWIVSDCLAPQARMDSLFRTPSARSLTVQSLWSLSVDPFNGALGVDDTYVYFVTNPPRVTVMKTPRVGGGAVERLTDSPSGPGWPADIAVDERFVYWTEVSPPRIYRVAK
jgi:hypothetical protein